MTEFYDDTDEMAKAIAEMHSTEPIRAAVAQGLDRAAWRDQAGEPATDIDVAWFVTLLYNRGYEVRPMEGSAARLRRAQSELAEDDPELAAAHRARMDEVPGGGASRSGGPGRGRRAGHATVVAVLHRRHLAYRSATPRRGHRGGLWCRGRDTAGVGPRHQPWGPGRQLGAGRRAQGARGVPQPVVDPIRGRRAQRVHGGPVVRVRVALYVGLVLVCVTAVVWRAAYSQGVVVGYGAAMVVAILAEATSGRDRAAP